MSDKIARPELGTWMEIVAIPKRRVSEHGEVTWESQPLSKPLRGMYCGFRTVYDGKIHSASSDDDAPYFMPRQGGSHTLWLLVLNPRKNPVRAFPDDCRELETP